MGAALQKSKSTLIDLLGKVCMIINFVCMHDTCVTFNVQYLFLTQELYPSNMVLDQFVQMQQCILLEEWDRFIQVVFQQSVEVGIYV